MPKQFQYQSGSLIYCQGDPADKVFLLQSGKVSLTYLDIEKGGDIREQVQVGEFFGARSALGRHPREENAITMADNTSVTAFTIAEFENYMMENTRIVMKMLKVFSTQMRKIHKQESALMEQKVAGPDEALYNIGEHYLKHRRFSHAKYVFNSYLTYYPSSKHANNAVKNLEVAENYLKQYGDGNGPAVKLNSAAAQTPVFEPAPKFEQGKQNNLEKAFLDAEKLVLQGKYQAAFTSFKSIIDADKDSELAAKSSFEMGRCIFLLRKYEECLKYYTLVLSKQPNHPAIMDIIFTMGQCNERINNKERAAAFYNKILSMNPDSDEIKRKTKQALDALGVS